MSWDAVAERYEVDQEKTVWTKTLWKYVSQEWDFRYYEMNDDSEDTDDDDILQVIDIVNGRDAHELIELWAKRRKIFRGVKSSSNVKEEVIINGDTIEEVILNSNGTGCTWKEHRGSRFRKK